MDDGKVQGKGTQLLQDEKPSLLFGWTEKLAARTIRGNTEKMHAVRENIDARQEVAKAEARFEHRHIDEDAEVAEMTVKAAEARMKLERLSIEQRMLKDEELHELRREAEKAKLRRRIHDLEPEEKPDERGAGDLVTELLTDAYSLEEALRTVDESDLSRAAKRAAATAVKAHFSQAKKKQPKHRKP